MRVSKKMCENLVSQLAKELKTPFAIEDASIRGEGRTRFNLYKVHLSGGMSHLNNPHQYTAKDLFHALRLTLDVIRFAKLDGAISELEPKGDK